MVVETASQHRKGLWGATQLLEKASGFQDSHVPLLRCCDYECETLLAQCPKLQGLETLRALDSNRTYAIDSLVPNTE